MFFIVLFLKEESEKEEQKQVLLIGTLTSLFHCTDITNIFILNNDVKFILCLLLLVTYLYYVQ